MALLKVGSSGEDVRRLQEALKQRGFLPGRIDSDFGEGTKAAVMAFQRSEGLLADGVAGPQTLGALSFPVKMLAKINILHHVTPKIVAQMFPHTPYRNIEQNLGTVLTALEEAGLTDRMMVLMALGTIRAETESFLPVAELKSKYNTSPGGKPFDLYDNRRDLGNRGAPDGLLYRGRGFVQLTGRANYTHFSKVLGLGDLLVERPDEACDAPIAARLLAEFIRSKERKCKEELIEGDLRGARRLVNGGSHGLDRFTETYNIGLRLLPEA